MLVVGLVSTKEEQQEIRFIAQICILKNRIQYQSCIINTHFAQKQEKFFFIFKT